MRQSRIHPFLVLTLAIWLGATVGGLIAAFAFSAPHGDPDGDIMFYSLVIGILGGGFLGLLAGILLNVWLSNQEPEQFNGLRLGNNKSKESE